MVPMHQGWYRRLLRILGGMVFGAVVARVVMELVGW